jgi:hypothetical protein
MSLLTFEVPTRHKNNIVIAGKSLHTHILGLHPARRARGRRHLRVQNAHFHVGLAVHCRRTKTRPIGRSRVAGRSKGSMYGVRRDTKGGQRDLGRSEADAAGPSCVMLGRFVEWWPAGGRIARFLTVIDRSTVTIHARPPTSAGRTACRPHGDGGAYNAQPRR